MLLKDFKGNSPSILGRKQPKEKSKIIQQSPHPLKVIVQTLKQLGSRTKEEKCKQHFLSKIEQSTYRWL
jgi:hypothetical protein